MAQQQTTVVLAPTQPTVQTAVVVHKKEGNACRAAIPAMHMAMAVTCLLFNIFLPGIGTIFAGFSVLCCANPGQSGFGKYGTLCLNFWVGLLQLALTPFIVGWIWSIIWGAAFIGMANDYHQTNKTTTTLVTTSSPGPQAMVVTQTTQPQPTPQSQGYAPPVQGYAPPVQGYVPPQQGYAPSPQGYAPSPQGYAPPQQGYAPPQQAPSQGYPPPTQGYVQGTAPPQEMPPGGYNYPQQPAQNPYHQQATPQQQPPPYSPSDLPPKKT